MNEIIMTDYAIYECSNCKRSEKVREGEEPPECCEVKMEPLPPCTSDPAWAEHARPAERNEPCDDGRSG